MDCYHFESKIAVADAVKAARGSMTLIGNLNNPGLLLNGTPEGVAEACRAVIAGGVPILAPECAVPLTTPLENLQTLVRVAEGPSFTGDGKTDATAYAVFRGKRAARPTPN